MSLQTTIQETMQDDETLAELLLGGVYTGVEITRQGMPGAFNENKEVYPCALVKAPTTVPTGPYRDSARTTIQIYFYERSGTSTISQAMSRTIALLNGTKPEDGVWMMSFADQVEDARDDGLECSMGVVRFAAIRRLKEEA